MLFLIHMYMNINHKRSTFGLFFPKLKQFSHSSLNLVSSSSADFLDKLGILQDSFDEFLNYRSV